MKRQTVKFRQIIMDLEAPLIYGLTGFSAAVGLFVYGATKIRSNGAILEFLQPVFGVPYALAVTSAMVAILINNHHWKGLVIVAASYLIMFVLGLSPTRTDPLTWNEYFALSTSFAGLLVSGCLHHDLLD